MKMKKVAYLSVLILSLVLMSTSCCKEDDPIIDEGLITLTELNGSWDFVSYNYNGTEYNCLSVLPTDIADMFISMSFNKTEMVVHIASACISDEGLDFDFTKDANVIKFNGLDVVDNDIYYVFTILSYSGGELKLRVDQTPFNYGYLGGTITLK